MAGEATIAARKKRPRARKMKEEIDKLQMELNGLVQRRRGLLSEVRDRIDIPRLSRDRLPKEHQNYFDNWSSAKSEASRTKKAMRRLKKEINESRGFYDRDPSPILLTKLDNMLARLTSLQECRSEARRMLKEHEMVLLLRLGLAEEMLKLDRRINDCRRQMETKQAQLKRYKRTRKSPSRRKVSGGAVNPR